MKKHFINLIIFITITFSSFAQQNQASMVNDFKQIASAGKGRYLIGGAIQTYSSDEVKGNQFFNPNFSKGAVVISTGEIIGSNYLFLFDKVRQELFIKSADDKKTQPEILLAEKTQIKSFTLFTDKHHFFEPVSKYDSENTNDFYEVLLQNNEAFTLLKFVKTTFVKMDKSDMQKFKNGDMSDEFVDKVTYFISFKNAKPQLIKFTKKSILNALPLQKKALAENYFASNNQEKIDEYFVINMTSTLNK